MVYKVSILGDFSQMLNLMEIFKIIAQKVCWPQKNHTLQCFVGRIFTIIVVACRFHYYIGDF